MLEKLRNYIRDNKAGPRLEVVVGFTQTYALEVHERTDVTHRVGQAKFLETAARTNYNRVQQEVREAKQDVAGGLVRAALMIQREAQMLTPVDTGALKASAFTAIRENVDEVASQRFRESEMLRLAAQGRTYNVRSAAE